MDDTLFSVKQVAILLKVHPLTIRRYIRDGRLKAIKIGGNIRIPQSSIDNSSENVQPTSYGTKTFIKRGKANEFNIDDSIFRVKGKGLSIRTI